MLSTWPRFGLSALLASRSVAGRRPFLGDEREHAVARLRERRKQLERLECRRQALAVTLVARGTDERIRLARTTPAGPTFGRRLGSGEGRRHELFIGHLGAILEDRGGARTDALHRLSADVDGLLSRHPRPGM
jgi:hypothetical protein